MLCSVYFLPLTFTIFYTCTSRDHTLRKHIIEEIRENDTTDRRRMYKLISGGQKSGQN